MGTREKLSQLRIKQSLYKDDYRPEILPPPPIGKSIGHGLIESSSLTIENPNKTFKDNWFNVKTIEWIVNRKLITYIRSHYT